MEFSKEWTRQPAEIQLPKRSIYNLSTGPAAISIWRLLHVSQSRKKKRRNGCNHILQSNPRQSPDCSCRFCPRVPYTRNSRQSDVVAIEMAYDCKPLQRT